MAGQLDAAQAPGGAVDPVASHYPLDRDLLCYALMLDGSHEAILVMLELNETGGAIDLTSLLVEILGQNRLGHFLRDANIEAVATATSRQIDLAEHASGRVQAGYALLDARGQ